jgi:TetR/AcrR family acrAB operon transcriptional repressor
MRRTQAERREKAVSDLVQAATRLIAERGLERFTLSEVGLAAGYSEGLPAHYFARKNDLIAFAARHIVSYVVDKIEARRPASGGFENLMDGVRCYFEIAWEEPVYMRALQVMLSSAIYRPEMAEPIGRLNAGAVDTLAMRIEACIASGTVRSDLNPRNEALLILAALRGVVAQWLVDATNVDLDEIGRAMVDGLRRRLQA